MNIIMFKKEYLLSISYVSGNDGSTKYLNVTCHANQDPV